MTPKVIILSPVTFWTFPSDWNPSNNKVECIGAGGNGTASNGGGGGAYAVGLNIPNIGIVGITMEAGGSQVDTSFGDIVIAKAGSNSGTGGKSSQCTPVTGAASGGDGGYWGILSGGGGAGGPYGDGYAGGDYYGGSGDAGRGGAGGSGATGPGGQGYEWPQPAPGCGCGGGGQPGRPGGCYGGGGGSTSQGQSGIIIITYTPGSSLSILQDMSGGMREHIMNGGMR